MSTNQPHTHAMLSMVALLAVSCAAPFPAINLVDSPRVLLISPTPTVVQPGEMLRAEPLIVGGTATVQKWRVCVPVKIDPTPEQRCVDGQGLIAFTQEGGQTLQWPVTTDESELGRWVVGANVDERGNIPQPARIFSDVQTNGLEVLIYVEANANGVTIRGFKRALLIIRAMRPTVAELPDFQFGTQILHRSDSHECVVRDAPETPVTVAAGSTTTIAPMGILTTIQLYTFSHFANGGNFLQRPDQPDIEPWIAPAAGIAVDHWLVAQRSIPRSQGNRVSVLDWCHFRVTAQ